MVLSGRATAAMDDGRVIEMKAGDVFYIAPGHDSWVVGDEPYVSLHFLGAEAYANAKKNKRGRLNAACRQKSSLFQPPGAKKALPFPCSTDIYLYRTTI